MYKKSLGLLHLLLHRLLTCTCKKLIFNIQKRINSLDKLSEFIPDISSNIKYTKNYYKLYKSRNQFTD